MANARQTASDFEVSAASLVTDAERRRTVDTPGDGHIRVMVLGDLIIFGAYFIIFTVYRAMKPREFLASQDHLNINVGVLNTLVLFASSSFIAHSVQAARADDYARALRLIYLGGLLSASLRSSWDSSRDAWLSNTSWKYELPRDGSSYAPMRGSRSCGSGCWRSVCIDCS